jgi:hypothetical protein
MVGRPVGGSAEANQAAQNYRSTGAAKALQPERLPNISALRSLAPRRSFY